MGYVPPVRDEQSFQYGNRYVHRYRGITPTSPVQKAKFQKILEEHEQYPRETRKNNSRRETVNRKKEVERKVLRKGHYIDEVV